MSHDRLIPVRISEGWSLPRLDGHGAFENLAEPFELNIACTRYDNNIDFIDIELAPLTGTCHRCHNIWVYRYALSICSIQSA